jgi:hypothetical protein
MIDIISVIIDYIYFELLSLNNFIFVFLFCVRVYRMSVYAARPLNYYNSHP